MQRSLLLAAASSLLFVLSFCNAVDNATSAGTSIDDDDDVMLYYRMEDRSLGFYDDSSSPQVLQWTKLYGPLVNTLITGNYAPLVSSSSSNSNVITVQTFAYPFVINFENDKTSFSYDYHHHHPSTPISNEDVVAYGHLKNVAVKLLYNDRSCKVKEHHRGWWFSWWKDCRLPSIFKESVEIKVLVLPHENSLVAIDRYSGKGAVFNADAMEWETTFPRVPIIDDYTTVDHLVLMNKKVYVNVFGRVGGGKKFVLSEKKKEWTEVDFEVQDEASGRLCPMGTVRRELLKKMKL